jgi:hypothetical protein
VGWYKNATVYRYYEPIDLEWEDGQTRRQFFSAKARAEDCVLLPSASRYRATWGVPKRRAVLALDRLMYGLRTTKKAKTLFEGL